MRKCVFVVLVLAIYLFSLFTVQVPLTQANDYALQIEDSRDTDYDIDIRSVYARMDNENIFFKLESWVNWNLSPESASIFIGINKRGSTNIEDIEYTLRIVQSESTYVCLIVNDQTGLIEDFYVPDFFSVDNPIGVVRIPKETIKMSGTMFSFLVMVASFSPVELFDVVPKTFTTQLFKKGTTTNEPKMVVYTDALDFGVIDEDTNPVRKITISNEGRGALTGRISSTNKGLVFTPQEINLKGYELTEVEIRVDRRLVKRGKSNDTIQIESNGGNATIDVSMEVFEDPVLHCETEVLDFETCFVGDKSTLNFTVKNKHPGKIKGSVQSNERWIKLSKTAFNAYSDVITVSLNTRQLELGSHEGFIHIQSNGGSHKIRVIMDLEPSMSVSATKIDFGTIDLDETDVFPEIEFIISNPTRYKTRFKIDNSQDWLVVNPQTIEIARQAQETIKLTINKEKMPDSSKNYKTILDVSNGTESVEIAVSLSVIANPPVLEWKNKEGQNRDIRVSVYSGNKLEELIQIANTGGGILTGSAELKYKNTPHRLFSPRFSLKKNETHDFRIAFDTAGQELKDYRDVLVITTNTGKLEIPIIISVIPLPEIVIKLFIGSSYAFIDEEKITLDAPPYISKGSSMVPLRFIGEAFKAEVKWENIGKGRIYITLKDQKIRLDIGESKAFINDVPYVLSVPPEIKSSRTFVPIRFISEGFGAKVEWDGSKNQISIRYNP
jgi:hypothetical protein